MENFRRRSPPESGLSFLGRALNGLSTHRSKHPSSTSDVEFSEPSEDFKGPLGLNVLYVPSEPLVDFIFVHGLGGGSRKTWSKSTNPDHYWPKEWLPRDPQFRNVRIHSFGYAADWGEKKKSVLAINDFGRSLLGEIMNDPEIRRGDTKIVLIGHSMGGLVIKKAYILARQDPAFQDLVSRFHSLYFLATPHRGSDLARTLTNILRLTWGQKPFVNDLEPTSGLISGINDTFRHYAQDLQLWSFYETLQSYAHERTALLNADHRGVCKFERPSDPNYKTLRNALSTTVEAITTDAFHFKQDATRSDICRLASFTGITDFPEDDLRALGEARITGSCKWVTSKKEFEEWLSGAPSILWLSGNPTSGKSVLASHVISHLERHNLDCSYFFYKHSIAAKSSVADCLRSIAYQMALSSMQVRKKLLLLEASGATLEKNDDRAIWRKLFLGGIFQSAVVQPQYWVIDALDECNKFQSLFSTLLNIEDGIPLRIFITSRKTPDIERLFGQLGENVTHLEISASDTVGDMQLFIESRIDRLAIEDHESRASLVGRILTKSNGSFLWVRLVMQELEHAWSDEGIEEVLNEIPADMDLLYSRTLENMSKVGRAAKLAKAILTWIVCASRLLTVDEMQCALKLDINETVQSLDRSIASICGQLVFVDQRLRIQMIHQTARDFLLQDGLDSEFAVKKSEGHARLAIKCLELLSRSQFKAPRTSIAKLATQSSSGRDLALSEYACAFFSDHLYKASSLQSEPWDALYHFLGSNVLSWIEHLARAGDLYYITRTATNIKAYLDRRAKHLHPMSQQVQTIEAWSVDMIRVSAKFRTILLTSPTSIHWLIPPMCPSESIIARKFTSPHRGLSVKGAVQKQWDDCLSQINYCDTTATAIAYCDRFFAVGLANGKITLYHSVSCQLYRVLDHVERVKRLRFGRQNKFLASSGLRNVRVWDLATGHQMWSFSTPYQTLALNYTDQDECLIAATQGDYIACWLLSDGTERARVPWHDGFREDTKKQKKRPAPTDAIFSPDRRLLAVSYRGHPILLFDVESDMFFGECIRRSGLNVRGPVTHYPIVAMTFNCNRDFNLLIASYGDGELTIYNPWTLELTHRFPMVNAQTLACSPDGRTLVTGGSLGTLQIFDMDGMRDEGLTLIYRIDGFEEGVKSLAFSGDSLRFIDIRGSQCRVWEPAVLVRRDSEDGDQGEVSDPVSMVHNMADGQMKADISAIACDHEGDAVFCGKEDGSLMVVLTEDGRDGGTLYKHATGIAIKFLVWGEHQNILISADEASRIVIRKLIRTQPAWTASETIADRRFAVSITSILLSPTNDRVLVGGNEFDELWTIQGHNIGRINFKSTSFHNPMCHALRPEVLIIMEASVARFFKWADLEEVTGPEGVQLNRSCEPVFRNAALVAQYQGDSILVEFSKPGGNQSSCRLELWENCNFLTETPCISPLPGFEVLGPIVKHIIATLGTSLLFLDTDMWVCSLDFKTFTVTPQVKRHFFIPSDWQSNSRDMLFQLTSKNEFVFVKRNEAIIIKRGLDYSEAISLAEHSRGTSITGTNFIR